MLVCRSDAAIDPLPGAHRREHVARSSEQRLYFTKDEETTRQQRVMEPLQQRLLGLSPEIDDYVPANDQMDTPHVTRWLQKVGVTEHHPLPQRRHNLVHSVGQREIGVPDGGRRVDERRGRILAQPRGFQRVAVDVRADDLEARATSRGRVLAAVLVTEHGE